MSLDNTPCSFFMSKFQYVMATMTMIGRSSERASLSSVERFVKNCKAWWSSTSKSFTALCATEEGEVFTRGEVVKAHLALAAVLTLIGIGGAL